MQENTIYTWQEVKDNKISACYCKCDACNKPKKRSLITPSQRNNIKFYLCPSCRTYIAKKNIKDISNKYEIKPDIAQAYKLFIQTTKQKSKLTYDQKLIAKIAAFQKDTPKEKRWGAIEFFQKFKTYECYLTGQQININDISSWSLDHIIPKSKGGSSQLSNCGLVVSQINLCKHCLTPEEFIKICKNVVDHAESSGIK